MDSMQGKNWARASHKIEIKKRKAIALKFKNIFASEYKPAKAAITQFGADYSVHH